MNGAAQKNGKSLIILGIDPGTRITGYGIIKSEQSVSTPLDFGCIRPPPHLLKLSAIWRFLMRSNS